MSDREADQDLVSKSTNEMEERAPTAQHENKNGRREYGPQFGVDHSGFSLVISGDWLELLIATIEISARLLFCMYVMRKMLCFRERDWRRDYVFPLIWGRCIKALAVIKDFCWQQPS